MANQREIKKNKLIKILIVILPILIISLFYIAPWFSVGYMRYQEWLESWRHRGPTLEEMRKYYESLPIPELTSQEVIAQMVKQKGLLNDNLELIKMVEWYVYHGDKEVIRQLIANLAFEVELTLPKEEKESTWIRGRDTVGKSYSILRNRSSVFWSPDSWGGLLRHISPVLHEELHRYAMAKADPHMIFLVMDLILCNEPAIVKPVLGKDNVYAEEVGSYANVDWYTEDLVNKDVLAYLRIYVNYKDWPTIRNKAEGRLGSHYPGGWLDSINMRDICSLADEEGVEPAYELYLEQYKEKNTNK